MHFTTSNSQQLFPSPRCWENGSEDSSVAIIMRTKNRPILLPRALASVLSQTYQNWVLYLVNDGGSAQIFMEIVTLYKAAFGDRLHIIHNEQSMGMEGASNCALQKVTESYIIVHDDDDAWHPDFLDKTVSYLEKHNEYAAVITNCVVIHEIIDDDRTIEVSREKWSQWKPFIDACNLLTHNVAPPICTLVRSSVVKIIGDFNENLPVLGDWDFNIRIFKIGDIGTIDQELAYYYQRPAEDKTYGNSVRKEINKHLLYQTLYRNALIRKSLSDEPSSIGFIHVILEKIERAQKEVLNAIHQSHNILISENRDLKEKIGKLDAKLDKILNGDIK